MLLALRFSLGDMLHDRGRTLLDITGLAVVVASYFVLSALAGSFTNFLSNTTVSRNLIVIQNDLIDPSDAMLEPQVIQAAQDMLPSTISRISPMIFRHAQVGGHTVYLRSAAVQDWEPVYHLALLTGAWPSGENEIVAGEGIVLANNWEVGSIVEIFGSDFTITGIFRSPGTAFASVWMPIDTYWDLFDTQRGYQMLFVQAAAGVEPEVVRSRLQEDARLDERYAVYFEDNYTKRNIQALQDLNSIMNIASWLALLGITFGVFNATTLNTLERGRELGMLLGIGFSQRTLRRFVLVRSMLQGVLAFGVGWIVASSYVFSQGAFAPFFILGFPLDMKITLEIAAYGLIWVLVLDFVGAWFSTRRLRNQQIVDLLSER